MNKGKSSVNRVPGILLFALVILLLAVALPALAEPGASTGIFLPFVTSPLAPVETYKTGFDESIVPWQLVRWQKNGSYDLDHDDGCDSGHCGFLDLEVDNQETYAIASPLLLGPNPPYEIKFEAKLRDREDKDQVGAVFGADWEDGNCPGDNADTCFNHYYEFRVRYRNDNGDKFLEYRLRRVDGHDGNNVEEGKDLVEWTRADGVNADDWHKWTVRFGVRGGMTFKVDSHTLPGSAQDNKYGGATYFGLMGRAGDNSNAKARFNEFSIIREE